MSGGELIVQSRKFSDEANAKTIDIKLFLH